MEILLQHAQTGLFAREAGNWTEHSADAAVFSSAGEATHFAVSAGIAREARLVARFDRETHRILLPLLGALQPITARAQA